MTGDGASARPRPGEFSALRRGTVDYVLSTADPDRTDRLWPADAAVYTTNPLNVAYGACGTALFLLSQTTTGVPEPIVDWMLAHEIDSDSYPPGLFFGLAGVAYTFAELGLVAEAARIMREQRRSPLLFTDPGIAVGAAGWGLVDLHLYAATGEQTYLDWAVRAGDHLIASGARRDGGTAWRCGLDDRVHYGLGYGASGIAVYLLRLYQATGTTAYLSEAVRGLEFDLEARTETELGWLWRRFEGDDLLRPYWLHGSAGVGSAVVRFFEGTHDRRYAELAARICTDAYVKFTVSPGLFDGLAGIGELMLDLYRATAEPRYADWALDVAETISWFRVPKEKGTAWPSRSLDKISNDYATGAAGIGLFLTRLTDGGPRPFIDPRPARPR
ncbi:lanthionine synthetase C family protein [Jiangella endophytica]|uniref:lanthionine synthetase C family protein n=1 Tax=Jiangella endophytica TaxID=1623398 RepID=UPI00130029AD|nr:lanthionine synthetase C family protein [Jiangella endophytica]